MLKTSLHPLIHTDSLQSSLVVPQSQCWVDTVDLDFTNYGRKIILSYQERSSQLIKGDLYKLPVPPNFSDFYTSTDALG
jgi:hypothetical protein